MTREVVVRKHKRKNPVKPGTHNVRRHLREIEGQTTLMQFSSDKPLRKETSSSTQQIMKAPIPQAGFYVDEEGILYKNGKMLGELSPLDGNQAIEDLREQWLNIKDEEWRAKIVDQTKRIYDILEMSEADYGLSTEELKRRLWKQRIHGSRPHINIGAIPVVKDRYKYREGRVITYGAKVRNPEDPITDWEFYDFVEGDMDRTVFFVYDLRTDRMITISSDIVDGHAAAEWFVGRPNIDDVVYIMAYTREKDKKKIITTYGPAMGYSPSDSRFQLQALERMERQGYITGNETFEVNWVSPETQGEGSLKEVKLHLRSLSE